MRANPRKPWKAIAAALVAGIGVLIAQGSDVLPPWALLILAALGAGLATFLVPNPPADE